MATSNIQAQQPIRGFGSSRCPHHNGQEVVYVCEDCQELVCGKCVTDRHKRHALEDLGEIIPEVNRNIQNCLSKLEHTDIPDVTEKLQTVNNEMLKEKQHYKSQIKEKEEERSSLKKKLENVEKSLKTLRDDEQQHVARLQNREQEIRSELDELRSKQDQLTETLRSGTNVLKYDVAGKIPESSVSAGTTPLTNESLAGSASEKDVSSSSSEIRSSNTESYRSTYFNINESKSISKRTLHVDQTTPRRPETFSPPGDGDNMSRGKNIPAVEPATPVLMTKEGIQVSVYPFNIGQLHVDCILNPVDENLKASGTVGSLVFTAAGEEMEKNLNDVIDKNKKENKSLCPVRFTCYTKPGKLKCKYVVHAVVPDWDIDLYETYGPTMQQVFKDELQATIRAGLKEADAMKVGSVALSPGMATMKENLCCCSYVKAILEFSRKFPDSYIKSIHIVDLSHKNIQDMLEVCQRYFQAEMKTSAGSYQNLRLPKPLSGGRNPRSSGHHTSHQTAARPHGQNKDFNRKESPREERILNFENKVTVSFCTGNILCVTNCKGLVVISDKSLQPMDALGNSIEKKAGRDYLKQIEDLKKNDQKVTDVVVTTSGNISNFRFILHLIMPSLLPGPHSRTKEQEFENELQGSLRKLFKQLEDTFAGCMNSVAIPLLGADLVGDKVAIAAILRDEVVTYTRCKKRASEMFICLVNDEDTTTEIMMDRFSSWLTQQQQKHKKPVQQLATRVGNTLNSV